MDTLSPNSLDRLNRARLVFAHTFVVNPFSVLWKTKASLWNYLGASCLKLRPVRFPLLWLYLRALFVRVVMIQPKCEFQISSLFSLIEFELKHR